MESKNPIKSLLVVIVAIATACCSSPLVSSVEWHLQVQGTVTDSSTGAPLEGVEVIFATASAWVGIAVYTDVQGHYLVTTTFRSNEAPNLYFFKNSYSAVTLSNRVACSNDLQTIDVQLAKVNY